MKWVRIKIQVNQDGLGTLQEWEWEHVFVQPNVLAELVSILQTGDDGGTCADELESWIRSDS